MAFSLVVRHVKFMILGFLLFVGFDCWQFNYLVFYSFVREKRSLGCHCDVGFDLNHGLLE